MTQGGNGKEAPLQLNLTRERASAQIVENLVEAGVLLRSEAPRYRKVLESYDSMTLLRVMLVSWQLREAGGEILSP